MAEREDALGHYGHHHHSERYAPSGIAHSSFMPFRPQSSNPLKRLEGADWTLYVVDSVSLAEGQVEDELTD
jgi:hypothetical protein